MKIYCLKCKTKTETNSTIQSKTKNNKDIVKGVCSVCGKKIEVVGKYSGTRQLFCSVRCKGISQRKIKKVEEEKADTSYIG